jgi:hypothetical protein
MGILTKNMRDALPASTFAGPDRSYPVPDRGNAIAAKSRASAAEHEGRMSAAQEQQIDAKANRVLGEGHPNRHKNLGKFLHPKKGY